MANPSQQLCHYPIPRFGTIKNHAYHLDIARSYTKPTIVINYNKNGQIVMEYGKMQHINEFISPIVFVINVNGNVKCIRWITVNGHIKIDETNLS
jgi:hypothetical protein